MDWRVYTAEEKLLSETGFEFGKKLIREVGLMNRSSGKNTTQTGFILAKLAPIFQMVTTGSVEQAYVAAQALIPDLNFSSDDKEYIVGLIATHLGLE